MKTISGGRRVPKTATLNPARAQALAALAEAQATMTRIDVPPAPPTFDDLPKLAPQVDNWAAAANVPNPAFTAANVNTYISPDREPEELINRPYPAQAQPEVKHVQPDVIYRATLLTRITYTVAIAAALFSGAVATYGLTKLAPGAEYVVFILGIVYEAGKLTSFAVLHAVPLRFKVVLTVIGLVLMSLNIAGVSGFLSSAVERSHITHEAEHVRQDVPEETLALLRTNVAAAAKATDEASQAVLKARANKGRIEAANAALARAKADQSAAQAALQTAITTHADVKATIITDGGELAAVVFLAGATGRSQADIIHLFILALASLPDLLAVMLLLAAPYTRRRIAQA